VELLLLEKALSIISSVFADKILLAVSTAFCRVKKKKNKKKRKEKKKGLKATSFIVAFALHFCSRAIHYF